MDPEKRSERIQRRILDRLIQAGCQGVGRSELVNVADRNNYRRGAAELERMCCDYRVVRTRNRYRLSVAEVDEIAFANLPLVAHFYELSTPEGRAFRADRLYAYSMLDVMVRDDTGDTFTPPYTYLGRGDLSEAELAALQPDLERERQEFRPAGERLIPEDAIRWAMPDSVPDVIPAGEVGRVLAPAGIDGKLCEIEVPAQPFAWTPQVHSTGPHNVAVMVLPEASDFWAAVTDFWA